MAEDKNTKFRRLAKQRGDRALREIRLVGNLSNRNNYSYTDQEVRKLFAILEEEIKSAKARFQTDVRREIKL